MEEDLTTLRQQPFILAELLDAMPHAVAVYEAIRNADGELIDFRTLRHNRKYLTLGPYTAEETRRLTLLERFPFTANNLPEYEQVIQTGHGFTADRFIPNTQRWYRTTYCRLGDGLVTTFEDITSEKKQQQELAERNRLLKGILETMHSGLNVLEAVRAEDGSVTDFRYTLVNQYWEKESGIVRDQAIGQCMGQLLPGTLVTGEMEHYRRTLATGQSERFELHYPYDGYNSWLDISVSRLDANHLVLSYLDTTEAKSSQLENEQLARRLQEQYSLLHTLIDQAPMGIALLEPVRDADNRIQALRYRYTNRTNAAYARLRVDQIVGRLSTEIFPETLENGFYDLLKKTAETGETQRLTMPYRNDQLDIWMELILVRQGENVLLMFTDVTEAFRQRKALENLNTDLKRSNEHLQQFAYVASHDLQEPLRKIQSFGDILSKQYGPQLGTQGLDLLRRMQSSAERMHALIQDLLQFSRLHRPPEQFQPVSLDLVLSQALDNLTEAIRQQEAVIELQPLPTASGNAQQLVQLFHNLLSNAVKFRASHAGNRVVVRGGRLASEDLPAGFSPGSADGYVFVEVRDNGIGFDQQYADRIFQMFQRLHGRQKYPGTGIGLAICQKVVDYHGGWLTASSEPGQGSAFTVYLPQA